MWWFPACVSQLSSEKSDREERPRGSEEKEEQPRKSKRGKEGITDESTKRIIE